MKWLEYQCNYQKDDPPLEYLGGLFIQSGLPNTAIIACGATKYTRFGEGNFLKPGDLYVVCVFNHGENDANSILKAIDNDEVDASNSYIILKQKVVRL